MKHKYVKVYVSRMCALSRWNVDDTLAKQGKTSHRGAGYHKGGAGIEKNPNSKRKPNDAFNMRKVKGKMPYRGIVREKSNYEKYNPFTGR